MTQTTTPSDTFTTRDRRTRARADIAELLVVLEHPVLLRGRAMWDGLVVGLADGDRGRVHLESTGSHGLRNLGPGPAELLASSPFGMLRFPASIVEVDRAVAIVDVDCALAELEERRHCPRFPLRLTTKIGSGAVALDQLHTTNVSACGMLVETPESDLDPGSAVGLVLQIGHSELSIDGEIIRRDGSSYGVRFRHATPAAERSLHLALAREAARHEF